MSSSHGAVITAFAGRGSSAADNYRIILPPLPSGIVTTNSLFLHCDVTGRPYRIDDFREELQRLQVLGDVASFGAYQMNHVWMVAFQSTTAKDQLLAAKELTIKGKRCLLIDPQNSELRIKIHWVPFLVSDDTVRRALEQYGQVHEVTRETWRAQGFQGIQSTTRLVRITLKEGVTKEDVPHQLRLFGGTALVLVPGRAPLCLRCKKTGHIRKDCRVPRCEDCHRYGHTRTDCVRTYAAATSGPLLDENLDMLMDEREAEQAASAGTTECNSPTESLTRGTPAVIPGCNPSAAPLTSSMPSDTTGRNPSAAPSSRGTFAASTSTPSSQVELSADATTEGPLTGGDTTPVFQADGRANQAQEAAVPDTAGQNEAEMEVVATAIKRPLVQENSAEEEEDGTPTYLHCKLATTRRGRLRAPKPRPPLEDRHERNS
ncbi:uncharacterized protein LOC120843703 [Ixodes scapularis]|uniref:uncharacterized protein LOC120843703 n=1 Tax=Ixodes scapularis TaxID=6945 RepID=UPI001A9FFB2A|nr:uncharacterized protein LOC120843703 [Ixodes scapularis]